jgi:hypothetical protein
MEKSESIEKYLFENAMYNNLKDNCGGSCISEKTCEFIGEGIVIKDGEEIELFKTKEDCPHYEAMAFGVSPMDFFNPADVLKYFCIKAKSEKSYNDKVSKNKQCTYESKGVVYYFLAEELNIVKIGTTINDPIKTRMKYAKNQVPCDIKLIATEKGGSERELDIHSKYDSYRLKREQQLEWFKYEGELKEYIEKLPK